MKKISEILFESQKTRKQITDQYFSDDYVGIYGTPDGYCAMGALACEQGIRDMIDEDGDNNTILSYCKVRTTILSPKVICEYCGDTFENLGFYIVHMNDDELLTFEQIGKEIQRLENEGIIEYDDVDMECKQLSTKK